MNNEDYLCFTGILKAKIAGLEEDRDKLIAVESLLGQQVTLQKRLEINNTIFVIQEIQQELLDERKKSFGLGKTE